MKQLKWVVFFSLLFLSTRLLAMWGTGWSTYPMLIDNRFLSTEFTGDLSTDGGIGFQGRYTHKINKSTVAEAGVGFSGGQRSGRLFVGVDYELFPDYMKQPRISVKTTIENSKEYNYRKNKIGVAPIVSKGFNFWGREAYPYASFPVGVSLDADSRLYDTFMKLSMGITAKIPWEKY